MRPKVHFQPALRFHRFKRIRRILCARLRRHLIIHGKDRAREDKENVSNRSESDHFRIQAKEQSGQPVPP